jgi:hypothetical protein
MEEHQLTAVLEKAVALQQERAKPLLLLTHSPVVAVEIEKARLRQLLEEVEGSLSYSDVVGIREAKEIAVTVRLY